MTGLTLCPLPHVFPQPDPMPLPTRFLFFRAPLLSLMLFSFIASLVPGKLGFNAAAAAVDSGSQDDDEERPEDLAGSCRREGLARTAKSSEPSACARERPTLPVPPVAARMSRERNIGPPLLSLSLPLLGASAALSARIDCIDLADHKP